ncbi:hypothetical protein V6N13_097684 [Hibiscus sabdariffa]
MTKNGIHGLQSNGRRESNPERLKFIFAKEFRKHFERLPDVGTVDITMAFSQLTSDQGASLEKNVMAFVREYFGGNRVDWSGFFCRSLRTFEVAMLNDLQACVGDYGLKIEVKDRLVLKHDMVGNFSVKGFIHVNVKLWGCGK